MSVLTTTRPRREVPPGAAGSVRWLVVPLIGLSVVLGAAAGYLASGNLPILALLFPVALLPVVLWRNPRVGVYLLLLAAVFDPTRTSMVFEICPGANTTVPGSLEV